MTSAIIRIYIDFNPTLSACPSCGAEQKLDGTYAVCSACDYHAGAELDAQWALPEPPSGVEIVETWIDARSHVDVAMDVEVDDEGNFTDGGIAAVNAAVAAWLGSNRWDFRDTNGA